MTVTLRVHPFVGMALAVVCFKRSHDTGLRFVVVEHPRRGELLLPLDWTDRGASQDVPVVGGREIVVDAASLRALARAVAAGRKVGPDGACRVRARDASHTGSDGASGMVGAADHAAAGCAGGMGDARAKDGATKGGSQ